MENICCVIDFDGFHVGGRFLVREFGYIGVDKSCSANSIKFDLRPYEKDVQPSQWKTVRYVTKHVTGLPFKPTDDEETIPFESLDAKVTAVHNLFKTSEKYAVAFKGGHVEKDVLERLGIPYVNLEDFGCPKFSVLREESEDLEDCGTHIKDDLHCPQAEVTTFRDWMLEKLS